MGKVILLGNQKGGVGKTATTGILAWILSQNYKVLCVDMDMQAHLTYMLTLNKWHHYAGQDVLTAMQTGDARPYIIDGILADKGHHLSLLPASEMLATLKVIDNDYTKLDRILAPIKEEFEVILIDTPPSLGDPLITSMMASDEVVCITLTKGLAIDGMLQFTERISAYRQYRPQLHFLGVLIAIFEKSKKHLNFAEQIRQHYRQFNAVFDATIYKRAKIDDITTKGIGSIKKADHNALEQYFEFAKELMTRVQQ